LRQGNDSDRKKVTQTWAEIMKLAPATLQVEITYRVPEHVVNTMGAGIGFEPMTFGLCVPLQLSLPVWTVCGLDFLFILGVIR
jgi:hypothetical protein